MSSAANPSTTVLKDFNWEVKVALSSDSMNVLNEPLVLLQLDLAKPSAPSEGGSDTANGATQTGTETRKVLELSKSELDTLLQSLTEASEAISAYAT